MTVRACEAGKDVYCEKPLTLTIAEGRRVVEVARRTQRIVQTGSQQRSAPNFRRACGLVRAGRLGRIQRVLAGIPGVNFRGPAVPDSAPPPELDYGLWLGPAALRPYNANRVHYNFRFFWDYSGGQLTNWGAHQNDIAQWGLGMDTSGPVEIRGEATYDETRLYEVPKWCEATYTYANGVTLVCRTDPRVGITFEGANGRLVVAGGTLTSEPPDLLGLQKETLGGDPARLRPGDDHHGNWLECIRSRKLPVCDVEIGHRSATVCHLGNIAMRCGRAVRWDPAREQIVGDDEANRMLSRPCREPWRL
jgi:predicted dehydrogenase